MKVQSFFISALFILLSGCANDAQIMTDISDNIKADRALGAHQVTVDSRNGVVTLDGYVASEAKRKDVERIAKRVEGVKEVNNRLDVNASLNTTTRDLCDIVKESMSAQDKARSVSVTCEGAQVILRGNVATEDAAEKFGRVARGTPGVKVVINLLTTPAPRSDKVL